MALSLIYHPVSPCSILESGVGSSSQSEILVSGIIDELNFDVDAGTLKLVELKTRWSPRLPCEAQKVGHRLQVRVFPAFISQK